MKTAPELELPPRIAWRERQFLKVGVAEDRALELALDDDIDVHDFVEQYATLLARGCPPELAERIAT